MFTKSRHPRSKGRSGEGGLQGGVGVKKRIVLFRFSVLCCSISFCFVLFCIVSFCFILLYAMLCFVFPLTVCVCLSVVCLYMFVCVCVCVYVYVCVCVLACERIY